MGEGRRAILHIGTEKTGSSSLQAFLAANRAALAGRGILYPRFPGAVVHEALAAYAMDDARIEDLRRKAGVADAITLAAYRARLEAEAAGEIAREDLPVAVLSGEHCSSRLTGPEEIARLKGLLDAHFERIDVAVYLRRQDRVAVSLYSTALKSGATRAEVLPPDGRLDAMLDYAALLDRWAAVFGRHRVHPRLYGRAELVDGSVVTDFAQAWGLGTGLRQVARVNESLRPPAQAFLRRLNLALAEAGAADREAALRLRGDPERALAAAWAGSGRRPGRDRARAFLDRFAPSNEAVRAAWFPGRARLFDDDLADYPEEDEPEHLDADTAVAMAATLWRHLRTREGSQLAAIANRDGQLAELTGDTAGAAAAYARARAADPDDGFSARRLASLGADVPLPRAAWEWQRTGRTPSAWPGGGARTPWQGDLVVEDRLARLRKALSLNGLRRLAGLAPVQPGAGPAAAALPPAPEPPAPPPEDPPAEVLAAGRGTLFFLHIPKTAGTGLVKALSAAFPPETIHPAYGEHEFFDVHLPDLRGRYRLIAAHAGWRVASRAADYIACVLRAPEDRVISLYNYWREVAHAETGGRPAEHPHRGVRLAGTEDFDAFLASELDEIRYDIRNAQAWMVARSTLHDARVSLAGLDEDALFELAAENLRSMDVIGTTDDLDAFASRMAGVLGLDIPVSRVNATGTRAVTREGLAPGTAARLAAITRVDRRLVDGVREGRIRSDPARAARRRAALPPRPAADPAAAGAGAPAPSPVS